MANYICACRTNYFKVGRPKEFVEWVQDLPDVEWHQRSEDRDHPDMIVCLVGNNPDGGAWPAWRYTEDDEEEEFDIYAEVAEFLAPGEVAIFEEVGSEKLRYLHGQAIAVREDGETLCVDLNHIYDMVKKEWPEVNPPTEAAY